MPMSKNVNIDVSKNPHISSLTASKLCSHSVRHALPDILLVKQKNLYVNEYFVTIVLLSSRYVLMCMWFGGGGGEGSEGREYNLTSSVNLMNNSMQRTVVNNSLFFSI